MTQQRRDELRRLAGRGVHLALADGSRLDDVPLVSVTGDRVWVFLEGEEAFLPVGRVIDFWEAVRPARGSSPPLARCFD